MRAPQSGPAIVVLMGAYNEEQYLAETIPAVLAQTVLNFQLVALDNGSTDRTGAMLRAQRDPRVTFIHAPTNLAPPHAANFAYGFALDMWRDCRWFLSAGADDLMAPDYLEAILDAAQANPDANCIFSPWRWLGHPDKGTKFFPPFDPETCHAVHQVPAWKAITRELWEAVGGEDTSVPIASDWDWVVRARHHLKPVQLEQPYVALRVREGERKSQSEEIHWPSVHAHLCRVAGKPVPPWAK